MSLKMMTSDESKATYVLENYLGVEKLYMEESYVGNVVSKGENNGYNDSDFLAVVYDEENDTFKEVLYATTRFWTYPNSALVDASPELMAKYAEWKAKGKRVWLAGVRKRSKARFYAAVEPLKDQLSLMALYKLWTVWQLGDEWEYILNSLARAKTSAFRLSLLEQVLQWANGESEYEFPLSWKQKNSLLKYWK